MKTPRRLKACPFCGEYPELTLRGGYYRVECRNNICPARLTASIDQRQIVEAWNTRIKPKPREKEDETP